jgi:hypothetical protein
MGTADEPEFHQDKAVILAVEATATSRAMMLDI